MHLFFIYNLKSSINFVTIFSDTRLLIASSSNQQDNLANLVRDPQIDLITLNLAATGTNVDTNMAQVVAGIQTGKSLYVKR